jgi:hypothetical protein
MIASGENIEIEWSDLTNQIQIRQNFSNQIKILATKLKS